MKVSTKGRYGLRVMIELALRYGNGPVMMDTISNCVGVSRKYLYNLLTSLKTSGLVRAVRGASGGFELTEDPNRITASEVVQSLEGPLTIVDCVHDGVTCPRIDRCASREVWQKMGEAVEEVLSHVTLAHLAQRQEQKNGGNVMYYI